MAAQPSSVPSRDDIARLVDAFYDRVQRDGVLGPVFNPIVRDWDEHKALLVRFWSSVALGTREYRGNPMAVHRPLAIDDGHFGRWLGLWRATTREVLAPAQADLMYEHALRIGASLRYGMGLDRERRRPLKLPVIGVDAP
ncbi:MAG: group III truncated hemoglobin [Pseudoxanthomonas sp.]